MIPIMGSPKGTRNQAPLPFGGGDGGGVDWRAAICASKARRYRRTRSIYGPSTPLYFCHPPQADPFDLRGVIAVQRVDRTVARTVARTGFYKMTKVEGRRGV